MKKLMLMLFLAINIFAVYAQSFTLKGTVVDENNNPFGYVRVLVGELESIGTYTGKDGKFEITIPDTTKYNTIIAITLGLRKEYHIDWKKNDILIVLDSKSIVMEEVIVEYDPPLFISDATISSCKLTGDPVPAGKKIPTSTPARPDKKPSTPSSATSNIKSGTLTAGEVNDFAKWHLWSNILTNNFKQYANMWGFKPLRRYIAQLTNKQGMPVLNAEVTLKNGNGDFLWQAKTDNTGKAELWVDFFRSETETDEADLKIEFKYEAKFVEIKNIKPFERGINTAQIEAICDTRNRVDLFFMIDATGSMSDEMRYLQVELDDIIQKINNRQSKLQLRTGCLVYRDHGDEYVTRKSSLSFDMNETLQFLQKQSTDGGGDYPEAVDIALFESITNEDWDDDALARILFIVLDAPSHTEPDVIARLESQLRLAAEKGVRIVPIACSDIKKDGEYLMRTFALATNGTYLFLTDDSGVGNAHIKPTTDKYDVEKLNDAIVRVVKQYTKMPDCNNSKWATKNKDAEESDKFVPNPYDENPEENVAKLAVSDVIKVYPNPCSNILKIDVRKSDVKDIYLVDMTGKTLFSLTVSSREIIHCDVHSLSTGVYFVKAFYKGKWFSEKIIVTK
jgi:hypothetical protein